MLLTRSDFHIVCVQPYMIREVELHRMIAMGLGGMVAPVARADKA